MKNGARLKSLSSNGALSWLHVPYNSFFGKQFTNQQIILLKSLILGSKITNISDLKCTQCKTNLDEFGHHALFCTHGGLMTTRHDAICDKIFEYCNMAKLDVKQEQRYDTDKDGNRFRIPGRPGDIKIVNYFSETVLPAGVKNRDVYVDVTVANIFADSYLAKAANMRGQLLL